MKRKNNQHTTTTRKKKKIAKKLEKGILALGFLHPFSVSIVFCFAMSKLENEALYALYYWTKGQLILKCPYEKSVSSKILTNKKNSEISALASKDRSNQKNKGTLLY